MAIATPNLWLCHRSIAFVASDSLFDCELTPLTYDLFKLSVLPSYGHSHI